MTEAQRHQVRAVATQPDRLEAFYREHLPFVRRYVARRLADPGEVADVTADVFVRVVRSAGTYRVGLGPPRAWLTGIARHAIAEHAALAAHRDIATSRLAGRRWLDEDSTERIIARIAAEAQARALLAAIAELPQKLRAVVELVAVDDLTPAEAAAVLGISAGAARVRYHRARALLHTHPSLSPLEVTS